ncbi:alpha/beta hydrolase [Streptomyces sp. NPDC002490]|uniref:alpha/beta fold hydrolase n=1 Tax=Streptomyces sp. NPDC002490 TaxID=3154416 RepID=UPI00332AF72C
MTVDGELRSFTSGDGELAYRDLGSGDPVVLLHPGFLDHRFHDGHLPALAAAGHRVIAPDARGHGRSANGTRPFRWADDLAALLRHLDTGPAVLVGVSMGGAIATDTALEHPDLVRALVVCGAVTSQFTYTDPWAVDVQSAFLGALAAGDAERWLAEFLRFAPGPHRTFDQVDPELLDRIGEMARHTLAKHAPGETDHRVPVTDTRARIARVTVPVLVVNGALDSPDLLAEGAELARTVPHGRSRVIPDAAHYAPLERPEAFLAVLGDFLRGL